MNKQILNLINELRYIQTGNEYIEEFNTVLINKPNYGDTTKLLFSFIPIYNGLTTYSYLKRTTLSFPAKVILSLIANIPIISSFYMLMSIIRSNSETISSSGIPDRFIVRLINFVRSVSKLRSPDDKLVIDNLDNNYINEYKRLKMRFPEVNNENQQEVVQAYSIVFTKYVSEYISTIDSLLKNKMDKEQLQEFNIIKREFNQFKSMPKRSDYKF